MEPSQQRGVRIPQPCERGGQRHLHLCVQYYIALILVIDNRLLLLYMYIHTQSSGSNSAVHHPAPYTNHQWNISTPVLSHDGDVICALPRRTHSLSGNDQLSPACEYTCIFISACSVITYTHLVPGAVKMLSFWAHQPAPYTNHHLDTCHMVETSLSRRTPELSSNAINQYPARERQLVHAQHNYTHLSHHHMSFTPL